MSLSDHFNHRTINCITYTFTSEYRFGRYYFYSSNRLYKIRIILTDLRGDVVINLSGIRRSFKTSNV